MTPANPPLQHSASALRGVILVLLAVLVFACMDTAGKHLMTRFNVPLVAAARYVVGLVLLTALMTPRHGRALWKTERTGLVVLRGLSLCAATLCAGLALQRMPVGETIAILYLQGFGIMLAAGYFLREHISPVGWISAAAGFCGVLLIARPGGALDALGLVFALCGAAVSVIYILLSRSLAKTESTMALLFHVSLWGSVVFSILLAINWQHFSFTPLDLFLLGMMGVAGLAGHLLFTIAYRFAPASMLAPFNYFHIAIATFLGWLVYGHVPDGWALAGMAMIALGGAAMALAAHLEKSKLQEDTVAEA
ncbi:MAG: DMT family transporter [Hyphomicrobiales bacterium]